jgi:hypothetical protein
MQVFELEANSNVGKIYVLQILCAYGGFFQLVY